MEGEVEWVSGECWMSTIDSRVWTRCLYFYELDSMTRRIYSLILYVLAFRLCYYCIYHGFSFSLFKEIYKYLLKIVLVGRIRVI